MNKTLSVEVFWGITKLDGLDEEWCNLQKCNKTDFGEEDKGSTLRHVKFGILGERDRRKLEICKLNDNKSMGNYLLCYNPNT